MNVLLSNIPFDNKIVKNNNNAININIFEDKCNNDFHYRNSVFDVGCNPVPMKHNTPESSSNSTGGDTNGHNSMFDFGSNAVPSKSRPMSPRQEADFQQQQLQQKQQHPLQSDMSTSSLSEMYLPSSIPQFQEFQDYPFDFPLPLPLPTDEEQINAGCQLLDSLSSQSSEDLGKSLLQEPLLPESNSSDNNRFHNATLLPPSNLFFNPMNAIIPDTNMNINGEQMDLRQSTDNIKSSPTSIDFQKSLLSDRNAIAPGTSPYNLSSPPLFLDALNSDISNMTRINMSDVNDNNRIKNEFEDSNSNSDSKKIHHHHHHHDRHHHHRHHRDQHSDGTLTINEVQNDKVQASPEMIEKNNTNRRRSPNQNDQDDDIDKIKGKARSKRKVQKKPQSVDGTLKKKETSAKKRGVQKSAGIKKPRPHRTDMSKEELDVIRANNRDAARRSRQRKEQHTKTLEVERDALKREVEAIRRAWQIESGKTFEELSSLYMKDFYEAEGNQ
eukprot:Awhi_evm1s7167